jgi:cellulose synthase operon protein C
VLRELAEQRRAERALSRGALSAPFVLAARARLQRLAAIKHPLAAIASSEILDTLGEEAAARAALSALTAIDGSDALVAALVADRLLALYRDDPRFFELYRPIAEDNLDHAEIFVRELLRGATRAARAHTVEGWLQRVDHYSDLAFLLELERALADLTRETQEPVRERVFLLYRKNKELTRRKALVGATVRRALAADNEYLLYSFADSWVSYVPRQLAERRRAERLYRDAVFERAYVESSRGVIGDARCHFYGVTLQTEALEAHAGFIEMRLAEKIDPAKDYPGPFSEVVNRYARAYLAARRLPELAAAGDAGAHQRADQAAIRELSAITATAPQRAEVHQLWGYVAYQRFLRTGERLAAVEANAHNLIALDLSRDNPRARAAILDGLGRVQAAVGNYGIALGWFEQRGKLPFADPRAQLSHCLALARARYHTGDPVTAASDSDRCLALIAASAELTRFLPLAIDRSGLFHLAAGQPQPAAARYAALWPLVESSPATGKLAAAEHARNRFTTRLGQASAALSLGKAREALDFLAKAEQLLAAGSPTPRQGPYGRERPDQPLPADSYALLLLGLRAQGHFLTGDFAAASRAMSKRRDAFARRYQSNELDEDRFDLALSEAQLALFARRRGAPTAEVLGHLTAARTHWTKWSAATGTPIEDTGLAILSAFAELHLLASVPMSQLGFDLAAELTAGYTQLNLVRNPAWEPMRARFELYLTTMNLRSAR